MGSRWSTSSNCDLRGSPRLPWLKPYPGAGLSPKERKFNTSLSRAHVVVECAFGRLKGRWRPLLKRNDVMYRTTISSPPLGPTTTVATKTVDPWTHTSKSTPCVHIDIQKRKYQCLLWLKGNFVTQPAAPHDLVIQHQDYRMYTLPDGTVKHKYGNVYYHLTLPCICAKQPHFDATQIVVSQVVKDQVTPVHHGFILAMLGVII